MVILIHDSQLRQDEGESKKEMAMSDSTSDDRTTSSEKDATQNEKCSNEHINSGSTEHTEAGVPERLAKNHQSTTIDSEIAHQQTPTFNGPNVSEEEVVVKQTKDTTITLEESYKPAIDNTNPIADPEHEVVSSDGCLNQDKSGEMISTNGRLNHVFGNLRTNDSPIHAVNELTDVKVYTTQWTPSVGAVKQEGDTAASTSSESMERVTLTYPVDVAANRSRYRDSCGGDGQQNGDFVKREAVDAVDCSLSNPELSLLEQTVGKLKTSIDNDILLTTSNADRFALLEPSHTVSLPSSAHPNYLQELLFRSQIHRRKNKPEVLSFVPKLCPPPMYHNRRGRPIRRANNSPGYHNTLIDSTGSPFTSGLDLSSSSEAPFQIPINNPLRNNESYFINRQPLRKILPKTKPMPPTKPLSLQIDEPRMHQAHLTIPSTQLPLVSPVSRPITSPCTTPPLLIDEARSNSSGSTSASPYPQEQPLDLCTKLPNSPKPESLQEPRMTPPTKYFDENQPLNLSTKRSLSDSEEPSSISNKRYLPLPLPPFTSNESIFWKTPPRSDFRGYRKFSDGESSSPLEGDTPSSGPAANSPGLDNQRVPYNLLMSPQMGYNIHGMLPVGQRSPTNHFMPEPFPEGAILLPGGSPHYRLSPRMALQHNEPPTPERPYMCEECGATFKRNKSLKQHRRVHNGEEHPFKCGECDKLFQTSNMLKQHEQMFHTEGKLFTCDVCPRRFGHPEKLRRHSRIHSGDKPYICETEQCNKRFTDASQLKLHMRTHSNHKPFPCPYCPLRFKYSGDVKRHVRIHTGEKPYVCGYCKMRFTQSNTLKQHERTHTGERPYHCHKCGMTFTQSGSLKYHLAHRHPQDVTYIITSSPSAMPSATTISFKQ